MRYTFVALIVVSAACSKAEPKSETEIQAGAAPAAATEAAARPTQEAPPRFA